MADLMSNEPGPADADRKIEQNVKNSYDDVYHEMMKKEDEAKDAAAAAKFDDIRKLGFSTKKDIDESLQSMFTKFMDNQNKTDEKFKKLEEWVMRKVIQANPANSGKLDDPQDEPSPMKSWERSWRR